MQVGRKRKVRSSDLVVRRLAVCEGEILFFILYPFITTFFTLPSNAFNENIYNFINNFSLYIFLPHKKSFHFVSFFSRVFSSLSNIAFYVFILLVWQKWIFLHKNLCLSVVSSIVLYYLCLYAQCFRVIRQNGIKNKLYFRLVGYCLSHADSI